MTGGVARKSRQVDAAQRVECKHGSAKTEARPYVISNFKGQKKLVTGSTCEDLLSSGCKLFDVGHADCRLVLEDGTEIDDEYLATCGDYTVLVILRASEQIKYTQVKAKQMIANIGKMLASDPREFNRIFSPLKDELVTKMFSHIQSLEAPQELAVVDSREEDPKWFEGEKRATTSKRAVLRERAKTRIRGYYYKSKDEMQKRLGDKATSCVRHLFEEFLRLLKQRDHNGHYFVRGETGALCLSNGKFDCQGKFSTDLCSGRSHMINPYTSREQLILFSTWNLDHRVERSRSILPTIVTAIQHANGRAINVDYFYRLLFTTENLKLVHPVCHIKSGHDGYSCDPKNWYIDSVMQDDGRGDETRTRQGKPEPVLSRCK